MYKRRNNNRPRRPNYRNYGRSSRSRHSAPTYNPMMFVRKASPEEVVSPYEANNRFSDFKISQELKLNISKKGYKTPTPIQDQVIPLLLEGKDVVGVAATGTGKTAAFLIPLANKVIKNRHEKVLIITPTRELAMQVEKELNDFIKGLHIASALCIGGVSIARQIGELRDNPSFVVGTPGRLLDLEKQRKLNFASFGNIVLDEVDRMLDMGFVRDISYIIARLTTARQSLFFSATLPSNVKSMIPKFLDDPVTVTIQNQMPSANVDQDIVRLKGREKVEVLDELLKNEEFEKVLVFGRTKRGIEKLGRMLNKRGVNVTTIHGNKSQNQRKRALEDFRRNKVQVLLATDVASRGLDIDNITHVINYDLPQTYEDYIHRIGRTGRANKKGFALTFVE